MKINCEIFDRLFHMIKSNIRLLVEIITVTGIVITLMQLNLQQKQFLFEQQQFATEQAQTPMLIYDYSIVPSDLNLDEINTIKEELYNQFFIKLSQAKQAAPEKTYDEILANFPPMSREVTTRSTTLRISILNKGNRTANKIRINVSLEPIISTIKVSSPEPSTVEGGAGFSSARIEIDRLVPKDGATIEITIAGNGSTLADKIILQLSDPFDTTPPDVYNIDDALITIGSGGWLGQGYGSDTHVKLRYLKVRFINNFPNFYYLPSKDPQVNLQVTSNEGSATQSLDAVVTPTP